MYYFRLNPCLRELFRIIMIMHNFFLFNFIIERKNDGSRTTNCINDLTVKIKLNLLIKYYETIEEFKYILFMELSNCIKNKFMNSMGD